MTDYASRTFAWNPAAYAASSSSQQAWAREMIAKLDLRGNEHILDVGCGDGKVSAELAGVVSSGSVTGIDASADMIHFARKTFPRRIVRNLEFHVMDARRISLDRAFDLIFSNAALHWVDDHPAFLRGAGRCLRPGGRLVVSCGGKGNAQDVFVALRAEIRLKRWVRFFRKLEKPYFFYSREDYEKWLPRSGFQSHGVRLADKDMASEGSEKFAGWLRTTWLPYTQRVPEPLREEFIAAITERYVAKYPPDAQGRIHVRMVRLEIDGVKLRAPMTPQD